MGNDPNRDGDLPRTDASSDRGPPEPPLPQPGRRRTLVGTSFGHYQIVEELGGGGMGVVYRAHDTRLDRPVALKFLTASLSNDTEARTRFFAEARAASSIDHPNICTVHEIGETDDGRIFIAMAHYRGETLEKRLNHGPLSVDEALEIAVQTARGLAKAHSREIVHRDIKPANLMVTEDGTVKILDFGTAKTPDLALTQVGATVGTVAYMSPEQSEGEAIDARTDIWSLGVVFYEMLTGRQPFRGDRPVALVYSILCEEPVPLAEHLPDVPPALAATIDRCLAKVREDRYETAADLIADLEVVAAEVGSTLSPTPHVTRSTTLLPGRAAPNRTRLALAVVVLALGALAIPQVRGVLSGLLAGGGPTRQYVAVLPLSTTDPRDEVLAAGLSRSLTSMIARLETISDSFWVVPAGEIEAQGLTTPSEVRAIFPVTSVLTGVIQRTRDSTLVTLDLQDPDPERPRLMGSTSLAGPPDTAFQSGIRLALAEVLGVQTNVDVQAALSESEAASPQAYPYYLRGVGYLQRRYLDGSVASAVSLFRRALDEDPEYAPAWAGLCEAVWETFMRTQDVSLAAEAISHCDRATELADDEPSVLVALASIYVQTGEIQKAEQTVRRALEIDPENAEAYGRLGRALDEQGRDDEALTAYDRAIELKPDVWLLHEEAAVFLLYRSRLDEAADRMREVISLSPDNQRGYLGLGAIYLLGNNFDEATRLFTDANQIRPTPLAYRNLGYMAFQQRDFAHADSVLRLGLELANTDWYSWLWLGNALSGLGRTEEARDAWTRTVELATPLLDVNPDNVEVMIGLAEAHALLDQSRVSRRYLTRALELPINLDYLRHFAARTYEVLGDRRRALEQVEAALDNGYAAEAIEQDPLMEDLPTDPAYSALIRGR